MIKLSIIIPVYNCQNYISECIESIIKQANSFKNVIEIIVVNDCSTDNSGIILTNYSKYSFIKIINLEQNGGVSNARNIGLDHANGKFVFFLDGDDKLVNGSIRTLLKYIDDNKYDVIRFTYRKYYHNIPLSKYKQSNSGVLFVNNKYNDKIFRTFLHSYDFHAIWGQLIAREYAKSVLFHTDLIMAEDFAYNIELYSKISKLYVVNKSILYYRVNYSSITHNDDPIKIVKKAISLYKGYSNLYKYDKTKCYHDEIDKKIVNIIASVFCSIYSNSTINFDELYNKFLVHIDKKNVLLYDVENMKRICKSKMEKNRLKTMVKKLLFNL